MFTNQPELSKKNLSNLIAGRLVTDTLLRGLVPQRKNPLRKLWPFVPCLAAPRWLRRKKWSREHVSSFQAGCGVLQKLNHITKQTAPFSCVKTAVYLPPTQLDLCVFSIQEAQVFLDICVVGIQQPQGDTPGKLTCLAGKFQP